MVQYRHANIEYIRIPVSVGSVSEREIEKF